MKKILIASLALATIAGLNACKKENKVVSTQEVYSEPTITLSGDQFYSIPINGTVPTISATAYDSVRKEVCVTKVEAGSLDNTTPGLYPVAIRATNSLGMYAKKNVFVAVTNIAPNWDLTGLYKRLSNSAPVNIKEIANGIYEVDNVGGAPTFAIIGYFLHINDSTISFPEQITDAGKMDCIKEKFRALPADTAYSWEVVNASFGPAYRVFQKQ
jgi:hypothetical protein